MLSLKDVSPVTSCQSSKSRCILTVSVGSLNLVRVSCLVRIPL